MNSLPKVSRHQELVNQYLSARFNRRHNRIQECIALGLIREERTFEEEDMDSFDQFAVERLGLQKSQANLLASMAPVCRLIVERQLDDDMDVRPEWFTPIARLSTPKKQLQVLQLAHTEATNEGKPVTRKLVQEVAHRHTGFQPKSQYKRSRMSPEERRYELIQPYVRRFRAIAIEGKAPAELVKQCGPCDEWDYFVDLEEWVQKVRKASHGK